MTCAICGDVIDLAMGRLCLRCASQNPAGQPLDATSPRSHPRPGTGALVGELEAAKGHLACFKGRVDLLVTSDSTEEERRHARHLWETADRLCRGIDSLRADTGRA